MNTCRYNYKTTLLCWVAVSALLLGGVVKAEDQKPQLTPDEQKLFNQLSPELQKALKEMTSDRQKKFLARIADMTPKQRERQVAFEEMRKALAVKDPDQKMDAMGEFVKSHGEFMKDGGDGPANIAFEARDYIKANRDNPEKVKAKLTAIDDAFPASANLGKSAYESYIAKSLLSSSVALDYAESQVKSSIELLHEDEYVESKKAVHDEREEDDAKHEKLHVPQKFNPADAKDDYDRDQSSRYATLGGIEKALGRDDAAIDAYHHSLKFHPNMNTYVGLSELEEAKGDKNAALENLYDADLTGHLDKKDIAHLEQLYLEQHPDGNEKSLIALLDEKYKATFKNAVNMIPYAPDGSRSTHTALAEFFTGAACEPCISPDLAFDASLERYRRKDMVLLVYHDNAPLSDPLANNVTEERAEYYSTEHSTPHAFVDGKELGLVEGPATHAQDAFDVISKSIDKQLDAPAEAEVTIRAKLHGEKVSVNVEGTIAKPQPSVLVHIDLIETGVSYSGENTIRLHPMVVRATAKQRAGGSGFDISNRTKFKAKYTFDLKKVASENLAYYSQFDAALKKRTHGLADANYREYENKMDPSKLAVAAFVQNNATKGVLQAAFASVTDTPLAGTSQAGGEE